MKNEPAVTNKLLELYKEQESYDSYDKTIEINTLRWVLDKDTKLGVNE